MFLRHDLHAKYYRGDDTVLVGSANLTATALGWAPNSNFELLTRPFEARGVLASFETELMRQAVLADGDTRDMVAAAAAMIAVAPSQEGAPAELLAASNPGPCWVPYSRNPENLRAVYAGDHESVAAGARADAERDLAYFDLPRGLGADGFRDAVAVVLRQHPLLLRIDSFAAVPRRFGELRTLVREYLDERSAPENATDLTQRCIRWLRYFTPTRYEFETPKYSEVLVRRRGNS